MNEPESKPPAPPPPPLSLPPPPPPPATTKYSTDMAASADTGCDKKLTGATIRLYKSFTI